MKKIETLRVLVAIGFAVVGVTAAADTGTTPPTPPATNAPTASTKHGHVFVPPGTGRLLHQPAGSNRPADPVLPADVKALVQQFQTDQAGFIAQRQKLLDELKQASAADRAAIRDQLRDLRNKWLDEQKQLREDIRQRLQEIKDQLKNQRDQQLRDADSGGDGRHHKH